MAKNTKHDDTEFLKKIGTKVRQMRQDQTDLNYIEFAKKVGLNKNSVFKVEKGNLGDYYITTLRQIIESYPKMTMSKFFKELEE